MGNLLRYNFRVMLTNNWWLLVFPLAVSQLSVFWMVITQRFSLSAPAESAEMISPILAAFLSAHILSAEYPARIAALLASKPLNIGKIVALRLLVVYAFVLALLLLSLLGFTVGWHEHYNIGQVVEASIPPILFLSMLALTFATLFRHSLAGFAVAALYWAMDLPPGMPMNPYLTLRSVTSYLMASDPGSFAIAQHWWVSKLLLLAGAIVLYAVHARLVFRLGAPLTLRARTRTLAGVAALLLVYVVSGATAKVAFGYAHRGDLYPNDGAWFRTQFASFGPLPVTYLYGPAFRAFIGQVPSAWRFQGEGDSDLLGATPEHVRELNRVLSSMAGSIWAPAAGDVLVRIAARRQPTLDAKVAFYQRIVSRYPSSPYVPYALQDEAQAYADANRNDDARRLYSDLLNRFPRSPYTAQALHFLVSDAVQRRDYPAAEADARRWIQIAGIEERFRAWMALAQILRAEGNEPAAKEAVRHVLEATAAFQRARLDGTLPGTTGQQTKWLRDAQETEATARRF